MNLEEIVQLMPDFDVQEFYELAKQINDFTNDPKFKDWAEIIAEATICKSQVTQVNKLVT